MKKMIFFLTFFLTSCFACLIHGTPITPTPLKKNNPCATCHGAKGITSKRSLPHLAGQHASYMIKQLQDLQHQKSRQLPCMNALKTPLSEDDITALSTWYARQPIPKGHTPEKYLARGAQLYRGGDASHHITACIICHGPTGTGNAQARFPVLSGQHAAYTIHQLQAFQKGTRSNDINGIMHTISAQMSADDMMAIAYYIQGLY